MGAVVQIDVLSLLLKSMDPFLNILFKIDNLLKNKT